MLAGTPALKPYFAAHRLAGALFVGTLAVWLALQARQAVHRRDEATVMDRGSRLVLAVCWIAGVALAVLARAKVPAAAFPADAATFAAGLVLLWTGIGLRWWSIRTLGRYFTFDVMTSADQPVITSGPYRVMRHPSYTGLLLIFGGIGVMLANWLSLALLIVFSLLGLIYRIHVEEAALEEALGDGYRSYAAHRRRIIPFVW
ncbi:MAG TPA: isoprenylcysteine carboxylmethyltransferase family protein [Chloroflexota bacterium]|nr:isoprenylcysteine carboxylmethyltransferase family protein [Chloroflexota bacterium]